jgi:methyl-accepting chemotaxis protein
MKNKIILCNLLISINLSGQAPLKKRVIMHQLQDDLNTLLVKIGADNVNQARHKIRRFNELLGYLQVPNTKEALKKVKKLDGAIYEQVKQNEKLIAENKKLSTHNKQIIAHADSMESTLQEIIKTKNEYEKNYTTHLDIFAKIPEKLPKIRER